MSDTEPATPRASRFMLSRVVAVIAKPDMESVARRGRAVLRKHLVDGRGIDNHDQPQERLMAHAHGLENGIIGHGTQGRRHAAQRRADLAVAALGPEGDVKCAGVGGDGLVAFGRDLAPARV